MARCARERSGTDYYHVLVQGAKDLNIFGGQKSFYRIRSIIDEKIYDMNELSLYACCIMRNHIHLLIKADINVLSLFIKRICNSYAIYYKEQYHHSGSVFGGRFKSEGIETTEEFWGVLDYIYSHQPYSKDRRIFDKKEDSRRCEVECRMHKGRRRLYLDTRADLMKQKEALVWTIIKAGCERLGYQDLKRMRRSDDDFSKVIKEIICKIPITLKDISVFLNINYREVLRLYNYKEV